MDLPPKEREAVFMTLMLVLQLLYAKALPVNPLDERWLSLYVNLDNVDTITSIYEFNEKIKS